MRRCHLRPRRAARDQAARPYQRKKGRDLFDRATALALPDVDPARVIAAFQQCMQHGGHAVTRTVFEEKLEAKLDDPQFSADIGPLLAPGFAWEMQAAADTVLERLIRALPEQ